MESRRMTESRRLSRLSSFARSRSLSRSRSRSRSGRCESTRAGGTYRSMSSGARRRTSGDRSERSPRSSSTSKSMPGTGLPFSRASFWAARYAFASRSRFLTSSCFQASFSSLSRYAGGRSRRLSLDLDRFLALSALLDLLRTDRERSLLLDLERDLARILDLERGFTRESDRDRLRLTGLDVSRRSAR